MAVKLNKGSLVYPLTSPPLQPTPYPPKELLAKAVVYTDRTVLVTVPFPDSMELTASVTNDVMIHKDVSKKSAVAIAKEIDAEIKGYLLAAAMGSPKELNPGVNTNQTKAIWRLPYDAVQPLNKAHLTLRRHQPKNMSFGGWTVKLEFSAAKAGPAGLVKLIASLHAAIGELFDIEALIASFRVARVDAAIDCIGAYPLDLIAHIPKPGKRMVFVGNSGRPESAYLYEVKPIPKDAPKKVSYNTRGTLRLTLYERRDYHIQRKLPPPYGNCPVTRAEVIYRPAKRPSLAKLASIPNQFKQRRIAYAAGIEAVAGKKEWKKFCMAAFGAGAASAGWSWVPGAGLKFEKIYQSCAGDLVAEACWDGWKDGIAVTGLSSWVELATQATNLQS